jgi:hypothetical protein
LVLNVGVEPFQDLFELAFLTEGRGVKSSFAYHTNICIVIVTLVQQATLKIFYKKPSFESFSQKWVFI